MATMGPDGVTDKIKTCLMISESESKPICDKIMNGSLEDQALLEGLRITLDEQSTQSEGPPFSPATSDIHLF
jgi:hypothetical protein